MNQFLHIISKNKAKELGMNFYFTGKPCKRGHVSPRYIKSGACKQCKDEIAKELYNRDREKILKRKKEYYHENEDWIKQKSKEYNHRDDIKERKRKYDTQYREENHEKLLEKDRRYWQENLYDCRRKRRERYHKNKHITKIQRKEYFKQYYKDNKDVYYHRCSMRRCKLLERTIGDYETEIKRIYQEAHRLRNQGYDVHVDHVIPLQGEHVSGLHVPWNLQIISSIENYQKGNKFDPYIISHL